MVSNPQDKTQHGRLPIKLIMPKQGTERRVMGGGGAKVPFREVDATYRQRLLNQVSAIEQAVLPQLKQINAAPVRVKLILEATAKTHRPDDLFSSQSCPIVGAGGVGELYVKATAAGLVKLKHMIEQGQSDLIVKELSCIESIEAVAPTLRRNGLSSADILARSPKKNDGFITRVKLLDRC